MTPELMTASEVAKALRISVVTVRRMMERGELPFIKIGYKTIRFNRKDIDDIIWNNYRKG